MSLLQRLPESPLDIVGDIHGELLALKALLKQLGYDRLGYHPAGRKLVFVGDLVDRGPDSHGAVDYVRELIGLGNAMMVLGNHELNLLVSDAKDGSGWFFDERYEQDLKNYAPFSRTPPEHRQSVRDFLSSQPIALVRDDIRVVHAAWTAPAIAAAATLPLGSITEQYNAFESVAQSSAEACGLYRRYLDEKTRWARQLEDETDPPPFLEAIAEYEAMQQMVNPLKVLTSGVERRTEAPFFAGNRWRYSDRTNWWDDYDDATPVVVGHYWRLLNPGNGNMPRYTQLFSDIPPTAWHGKRHNVFCVDFSVGARWRDRKTDRPIQQSKFKLAALQWPENQLVFDTGEIIPTQ